MASAPAAHPPPKSKDEDLGDSITRRETRRVRAVDVNEKSKNDEPATESAASDQEQPIEFQEGGYGW